MPYKLEYLPAARQDILDMVRYVSTQLQNPSAAARLAERLVYGEFSVALGVPVEQVKEDVMKRIFS